MSPRISSEELGRISRRLSDRDGQIIELAYELRVMAARHVEGLIITEGSALTRARRSRAALSRLTDFGVLARLDRRIGGVRAGSSGYLYRLAAPGRRLLGLPVRSGWREPGFEHVAHIVACADLHLALAEAQREGRIEGFEIEHEPTAWRRYITLGGASSWVKPDAFVQVLTGDYELLWFVEVDRGTESTTRVRTKLDQYLDYARTGLEQRRHEGVFPRIAWLAPDTARMEAIKRTISAAGATTQTLTVVGTTDAAVNVLAAHEHDAQPGGGS